MTSVSVIVPVYNTKKYLHKCLDSLINQTLKDIEIICINDGSTDNSLKILNDYAQKDNRIKVLSQENKKQGAARNAGLEIATGEYIGYVDSDDWVDSDFYEKLYNAAKKHNFDIALGTNIRVKKNANKKRLHIKEEKEYTTLQEKLDVNVQWKNPCPTNKIYKKSLLVENNIKWPEGVFCEDRIYTLKAVYYANGIVTVPNVNYYYYKNPSSTVNNKITQHLQKMKSDKNEANKEVLAFLKNIKEQVRDKNFWAVTKEYKICNHTILKVKESLKTKKYYLFGIIKIWSKED